MTDSPGIIVAGIGAVSPAGWGMGALRDALKANEPLAPGAVSRPGWETPLPSRRVPPLQKRPSFLVQARLRRSSPVTQFSVAAAMEALGENAAELSGTSNRLGIVSCAMSGCVNYSRRFYDETLRDPATASPMVFPETVFNAPASHLAALLQATALNYTLVGDAGTFLQGLAIGAGWIADGRVEGCLVIGAEESDWLAGDASRLFSKRSMMSEGAGAMYLRRQTDQTRPVELRAITDAFCYLKSRPPRAAAMEMRRQLPEGTPEHLLCDSLQGVPRLDAAEAQAWQDWPGRRLSPKRILGEAMIGSAAWQCAAAVDALQRGESTEALVSVVGCNQQAIGAHFATAA